MAQQAERRERELHVKYRNLPSRPLLRPGERNYAALGLPGPILPTVERFGGNVVREAGQIAKGLPAAGYTFGKAFGHDIAHGPGAPIFGERPSMLWRDIGQPGVAYYRERYVDPIRERGLAAGLRQIGQQWYEQPVTGTLDLAMGAGAVARTGSIAKGTARTGSLRKGIRESYYPEKRRTLTHENATVDLPVSRHPLVRWAQDLYDAHAAPGISSFTRGRVASQEKRVGKHSARNLTRLQRAEQAAGANLARQVQRLGSGRVRRKLSFNQIGHDPLRTRLYWEAQLPPEMRNNEGLTAIQNDLAYGLRNATGRTRRQLMRRVNAIEQAKKATPTPQYQRALAAMEELGSAREAILVEAFGQDYRYQTERPRARREAETRLAELDEKYEQAVAGIAERMALSIDPRREQLWRNYVNSHIGKGKYRGTERMPTVKEEVRVMAEKRLLELAETNPQLRQVAALIEERRALRDLINEAAFDEPESWGTLPTGRSSLQEQMRTRRSLLAERVGAGGEGVYVPHAQQRLNIGRVATPRAASSGTVGKTSRTGTGLAHRNELVLYELGELLTDPDLAVQAWAKAQSIAFLNRVKAFLADVSEPIDPALGPKRGAYIVNREGKSLPLSWRRAEDSDELLGEAAQSYLDSFLAHEKNAAPLIEAAGGLQNVRQVDPRIVHQLYTRLGGGVRGTFGANPFTQGLDLLNGLVKTSLLYANPAYIPANLMGNLAFGVLHQGALLPANLLRAAHMRTKDPELWNRITAQVGHGPTVAIAGEPLPGGQALVRAARRGERRIAQTIGALPDNWPRVAAWVHEARKAGYGSSERMRKLLDAAEHSPEASKRLQISLRSNNAMVDFERLAPWEKDSLARIFFVWPWVRGATAWAAHYAKHYPERAALIAQQAERSEEETQEALGGVQLPPWLQGSIVLSVNDKTARISPTLSLSPAGTALQSGETLAGYWNSVIHNKPLPKFRTLWDMTNPLFEYAYGLFSGKGPYGQDLGLRSLASEEGLGLVPNVRTALEITRGPQEGKLVRDESRGDIAGRRLLRGYPQTIDLGVAAKQAQRRVKRSAEQKARAKESGFVRRFKKVTGERPPASLLRDLRNRTLYEITRDRLEEALGVEDLTDRQDAAILAGIFLQQYPTFADPEALRSAIREGSPSQVRGVLASLRGRLGLTAVKGYSRRLTGAEDAVKEQEWAGVQGG